MSEQDYERFLIQYTALVKDFAGYLNKCVVEWRDITGRPCPFLMSDSLPQVLMALQSTEVFPVTGVVERDDFATFMSVITKEKGEE